MCGITGLWRTRPLRRDDELALDAMMDTLVHRGPDGRGRHLDEARGLAMGHTRLAIIDLHTGEQPIVGPGGRAVLTINGELYDYKLVRTRMVCDGLEFTTKTDSETAIHLYERHGLDFPTYLRGEFAIAIFDTERDRLVLVRDRFGVKPLYVRVRDDVVQWGSEVKAILAHPEVTPRLSARSVLSELMQTMVPGTTTFEEVTAIRPGHMMIVERHGDRLEARVQRWWDADFPAAEDHDPQADADAHVQAVREALIDAVRVRLEADVPVGCYLSGGIDSCSALGLASAMQQSHVKAFTISFDDAEYDEAEIANHMAVKTKADQELLRLSPAELYGSSYERTLWHAERTFYNTLGVAKWHMSRRVHECGYKVVVTGEGSDELFGGYPFFKRDYLLHCVGEAERDAMLARLDGNNAVVKGALLAESSTEHSAWNDLVGFTPSWIQPWILTLAQVRPLLSAALREELADYDPVAAIAETIDPSAMRGRHPLDKVQYTWKETMLEGQILTWGGDRVDMANSMESRPPFLDNVLADVAFRVPPHLRINDMREKWVLREAMKEVLPRVLYEREKFAFMAPPATIDDAKWSAVKPMLERDLSTDAIEQAGLFDAERVAQFLAATRARDERSDAIRDDIIVNHLLGLQILHRQFVQGDGRPEV